MTSDNWIAVAKLIDALKFSRDGTYSWFGRPSALLPAPTRKAISEEMVREHTLDELTRLLYSDFYCCGFPRPSDELQSAGPLAMGTTPFVSVLEHANSGRGFLDPGWTVSQVSDDGSSAVISQEDLSLWISPEELAASSTRVQPGDSVHLRMPNHFLNASPGFYGALSDQYFEVRLAEQVRLYWHIEAVDAAALMALVTRQLNESRVAFQLKVLSDPSQYTRRDAGVLYLQRQDYSAVCDLLQDANVLEALPYKPGVPAFTKPLSRGIGLAESPLSGESFGMHRCRLIAEAMVLAGHDGKLTRDERLQVVMKAFEDNKISLAEPHLNPGSDESYAHSLWRAPSDSKVRHHSVSSATYLEQAAAIARAIAQEAIWYRDSCNWIGAAPDKSTFDDRSITYAALGPELYNGTSGIALFLAEVGAATGDRALKKVAAGALRQALSYPLPATSGRCGLYSGWTGIAMVGSRASFTLESSELAHLTDEYIQTASTYESLPVQESDLISGLAGGICALLTIVRNRPDVRLLELALQMGDTLIATADRSGSGWSWRSTIDAHQNLTGFAHGAAGIGHAFVELHRATGEARFGRAAQEAFTYENCTYSSDERNWPDFRRELRRRRLSFTNRYSVLWCHGAPGIALSRISAFDHLGGDALELDASNALHTTRRSLKALIETDAQDYSLCHGLAGLAEVLCCSPIISPRHSEEDRALVQEVAAKVSSDALSHEGLALRGGCPGVTPGLMLGLAGIGHFFLRLHSETVPSPTLVGQLSWK